MEREGLFNKIDCRLCGKAQTQKDVTRPALADGGIRTAAAGPNAIPNRREVPKNAYYIGMGAPIPSKGKGPSYSAWLRVRLRGLLRLSPVAGDQ